MTGLEVIYQTEFNLWTLMKISHQLFPWKSECLKIQYIYVNDIGNSCDGNILSFADDTTLFLSHSNIGKLYELANKQINYLYEWFCKLSFNVKKTKYITIKPENKKCELTKFLSK